MESRTCCSCQYFRLHYIRDASGKYMALTYGHCVKPRLKKRYARDAACCHWQGKETPAGKIRS